MAAMRITSALLSLLFAAAANAVTINIDLGPNRVLHSPLLFNPTDLTGIPLAGQTISVDYDFGNTFVRLFPQTGRNWFFASYFLTDVTLQTGGIAGLAGFRSVGYLTGADGSAVTDIFTNVWGGGGWSDDPDDLARFIGGSICFLEPFLHVGVGTFPGRLNFYGAHFDVTLPNFPGHYITGEQQLHFSPVSGYNHQWQNIWAIGPQVPEGGSSLALLVIGVVAVVGVTLKNETPLSLSRQGRTLPKRRVSPY